MLNVPCTRRRARGLPAARPARGASRPPPPPSTRPPADSRTAACMFRTRPPPRPLALPLPPRQHLHSSLCTILPRIITYDTSNISIIAFSSKTLQTFNSIQFMHAITFITPVTLPRQPALASDLLTETTFGALPHAVYKVLELERVEDGGGL